MYKTILNGLPYGKVSLPIKNGLDPVLLLKFFFKSEPLIFLDQWSRKTKI